MDFSVGAFLLEEGTKTTSRFVKISLLKSKV